MIDPATIITINDVRRAGYCALGARRWFEAQGFDFRAFLKNGIPAEQFLSTGDAHAKRVVERKMERTNG